MDKIVITGASGFIGRNLIADLIADGYEVLSIGRDNTDYSYDDLLRKLNGYNVLVHLAGARLTRDVDMERLTPFSENTISMLDNLLKAAKENNFTKVITASSIGVYSLINDMPFSEIKMPKPTNPYGLTKLIAEQMVDMWGYKNKITTAHIRLAACYGYGEKDSPALMKFVKKAKLGEPITLDNGGLYQIDQLYIKDTVNAFKKLIRTNVSGSFNAGSGVGYSIKEIAKEVINVFESNSTLQIKGILNRNEPKRHMNIDKAESTLGWRPQYSLQEGLEDMKREIASATD